MSSTDSVTVVTFDHQGNFWSETVPVREALLRLLTFTRKYPGSICNVELRVAEQYEPPSAPPVSVDLESHASNEHSSDATIVQRSTGELVALVDQRDKVRRAA